MVRKQRKNKAQPSVGYSGAKSYPQTARTCPVYLRDLVSFLKRYDLADHRQVSHYFDSTIASLPASRLPRHHFHSLNLHVNDTTETGVQLRGSLFGRGKGSDCCEELMVRTVYCRVLLPVIGSHWFKESAGRLVGERIFPSADADDVIRLEVGNFKFRSCRRHAAYCNHGLRIRLLHASTS
jgi:hypothetical protein